jgi:hypothetical protein
MQLELATFTPGHMDLTSARNAGEQHEARVLKRALKTDCCYVGDCAYSDRGLLDAIVAMQSSYVMRLGENIVFEVLEERGLSQEALDAGVVRDAIVRLGGPAMRRGRASRCLEGVWKEIPVSRPGFLADCWDILRNVKQTQVLGSAERRCGRIKPVPFVNDRPVCQRICIPF